MAAVMGKTEIKVKVTGQTVTVPSNDFAKLMYYFNCVCSCVEPENNSTVLRLKDYQNYASLSSDEKGKLLAICLTLSPDKLIGTVMFPSEDIGSSSNEFLELSAVSTTLIVAESLIVGGQQKKIKKIMLFKKSLMENNFIDPLRSIERSRRPPPRRSQGDSCVIL